MTGIAQATAIRLLRARGHGAHSLGLLLGEFRNGFSWCARGGFRGAIFMHLIFVALFHGVRAHARMYT